LIIARIERFYDATPRKKTDLLHLLLVACPEADATPLSSTRLAHEAAALLNP